MYYLPIFYLSALLYLGREVLEVEVVDTPAARAKGLMGRESLADGQGMLFVFSDPQILYFHMKGTKTPLSIGFFDENRKLIEWLNMKIPSKGALSFPTYSSSSPALYALEVPENWFKRHEIAPGMEFHLENTSLDQGSSVK